MDSASIQMLTTNNQSGKWLAGFRSLQFKASVLAVTMVLTVTAVGTLLSIQAASSALYDNERVRIEEWAVSLASSASPAVIERERESLIHTVNDLVQTGGAAYAVFADSSGAVLASAEACAGLLEPFLYSEKHALRWKSLYTPQVSENKPLKLTFVDVVVPVYANTSMATGHSARPLVGYLRIASDISDSKASLGRIFRRLMGIALGVVLLTIPCSILITRRIVAPLHELARTAHAIANGAMDARAQIYSRDEIGALAESFNTMADRVAGSQLEMLQLNAELEERVQQRTRELEELAARDPLTGLYNRRYFAEVLAREFATAERYDSELTCLMFDLDQFKNINDKFGHGSGDVILITLAKAISGELRESDIAARFGGDEFILVLPQTSTSSASALADRIVHTFTEEVTRALPDVGATLSIGVASLSTTHAPSAEALIHKADLALYAAKQAGRNCTVEASSKLVAQ